MRSNASEELKRKAEEIFHCEKNPMVYFIKSNGDVTVPSVKEKKSEC